MLLHRPGNRVYGILAFDVASDAVSIELEEGHSWDDITTFPSYGSLNDEIVTVSGVTADTVTVERGTTATTHRAGSILFSAVIAEDVTDLQDVVTGFLVDVTGGRDFDGVIRTYDSSNLLVSDSAIPDMVVNVSPGRCVISNRLNWLTASEATAVFVAPVANPRIDLVQFTLHDGVTVKTGTEGPAPAAPALDANSIALAEVYHRVGETSIKDANDAVNGYITDRRVWL